MHICNIYIHIYKHLLFFSKLKTVYCIITFNMMFMFKNIRCRLITGKVEVSILMSNIRPLLILKDQKRNEVQKYLLIPETSELLVCS